MSLLEFANGDEDAAYRAGYLSNLLLVAGERFLRTINAAGLIRLEEGSDTVTPFVAVNADALGGSVEPGIRPLDDIAAMLEAPLSGVGPLPEWFFSSAAWVLPALSPQSAVGSRIVQRDWGTRGFPVTWNGIDGFLTAGHVVGMGGGPVLSAPGNAPLGSVACSADPNGSGAAPSVDVAVVQELPGTGSPPPVVFQPTSLVPMATDRVSILGASAVQSDWVRAFAAFYYCGTRKMTGTFGEVYMTASGTTRPGDSGAAAHVNGCPVGSVVAGSPGYVSLIQKIDYQIAGAGLPGLRIV